MKVDIVKMIKFVDKMRAAIKTNLNAELKLEKVNRPDCQSLLPSTPVVSFLIKLKFLIEKCDFLKTVGCLQKIRIEFYS